MANVNMYVSDRVNIHASRHRILRRSIACVVIAIPVTVACHPTISLSRTDTQHTRIHTHTRTELRSVRIENMRLQGLANNSVREVETSEMLRKENRTLRSEHIEITAHLEAMRRMLEVSTRCLRF